MTERTASQAKAVRLAAPSRFLRRLPGGYWVGSETAWRGNEGMLKVPADQCVGTQTVMACARRGWMEVTGDLARLIGD